MNPYPAPWRVDAYLRASSTDGVYTFSVRAADGKVLLEDCGEEIARAVVAARNASTDSDSALAMQKRYEEALKACQRDREEMRQHFQCEIQKLATALEEARAAYALG